MNVSKKKINIILSNLMLSNVGCEIIIRGTVAFLKNSFNEEEIEVFFPSYNVDYDKKLLSDLSEVTVIPMKGYKKILRGILRSIGLFEKKWSPRFDSKYFKKSDLFVSLGGDIYTMFGNSLPVDWIECEKYATKNDIPSLMFGANMEKFEILSVREKNKLLEHLGRFKAIFVRDVATKDYLRSYNIIENVRVFPDPIFSLRKDVIFEPNRIRRIGINFTPIILRDFGEAIIDRYVTLIKKLVDLGYEVELISHVYSIQRNKKQDDFLAMEYLFMSLPRKYRNVVVLHDEVCTLSTTERRIKGVDLFIGARMHGCLNALTSGKPVIFLGYSSKAETMVATLKNHSPFSQLTCLYESVYANVIDINFVIKFISEVELKFNKKTCVQTDSFLKALSPELLTNNLFNK